MAGNPGAVVRRIDGEPAALFSRPISSRRSTRSPGWGDVTTALSIGKCSKVLCEQAAGAEVRTVTIGASVALIIIGAVLKFGVTWHAKNVDIQVIGVILMIAGAAGLVISVTLLMMRRNDMRRRSAPPPPGQVPGQVYEDRPYNEPPV